MSIESDTPASTIVFGITDVTIQSITRLASCATVPRNLHRPYSSEKPETPGIGARKNCHCGYWITHHFNNISSSPWQQRHSRRSLPRQSQRGERNQIYTFIKHPSEHEAEPPRRSQPRAARRGFFARRARGSADCLRAFLRRPPGLRSPLREWSHAVGGRACAKRHHRGGCAAAPR